MSGGGEARVELYWDVETVSLETRVPLQAVIAILENLKARVIFP